MKEEIVTQVKDKAELEFILRALAALGHSIHNKGMSVEKFLAEHGGRRSIALSERQGVFGKGIGFMGPWLPQGEFLLLAAKAALGPKPVEVKLNDQYSAVVTMDEVTVGCQTFDAQKVLELADKIRELRK